MTTLRDKVNSHLPIVLQFLSTTSLIVIAVSAICGSQSLKKLSGAHEFHGDNSIHNIETIHEHESNN